MRALPLLLAAAAALAAAAPAAAQAPECPFVLDPDARNICTAAVEGTRTFHPLAGGLVSGGNPVLGRAGTLGGLGRFRATLRLNAGSISIPSLDYDGSSTTVEQEDEIAFPAPLVEAAAGVFDGIPGGYLGLDLLGAALLLPEEIDDVLVDEDATRIAGVALGLGYGVRVGVLPGRGLVPAVSVSVMRRHVPTVRYGDLDAGDDYAYAVDLAATNLRLVASSELGVLQLAAGVGRDRYTGDAVVRFTDPLVPVARRVELELGESRTLLFVDAGVSLGLVSLVGEVGWQSGTDEPLDTTFEGFDPEEGMVFGSLGVQVGL